MTNPMASPPLSAASDSAIPSLFGRQPQPFSSVSLDPSTRINGTKPESAPTTPVNPDIDPQIIEALKSKDRLFVLKLGELMEGLINDQRDRISLTPSTSYQRLLVHRCSAYYKLVPESDPATKGIIFVSSTTESRIPMKRLCELVQLESIVQPAFKIMRRSQNDRRPHKPQSQAGSVTGEEADLSDVEPSESGSLGGRSNATGGSGKKRLTIEQREAAYNEARNRIFMDFEEKEKEKEKDMSASSSSVSLVSGSASTGVTEDFEEPAGSPVTESEYSREKKISRHFASSSSSSRSLRSSAPSFNGNSRNSRASSPSFAYANIYDPSQHQVYDPPHHPPHPGYHQPQYYYHQYPPSGPQNPYYGGYPYYPPYNPYQTHQPLPQHPASDPTTPSNHNPEQYLPHPHGTYPPPYGWSQPNLQSGSQMQHPPPPPPLNPNHTGPPPLPPHNQQYPPYPPPPPPHAYNWPMPYYPPSEQPMEPAQNIHDPSMMNSNMMGNQMNNVATPTMGRNGLPNLPGNGRGSSGRHLGAANGNGGGRGRGVPLPPNQGRSPWSYGPGVGPGGPGPLVSVGLTATDTVGPRLSSSKRQSGNSSNSRSSNDEVSSTASSSTTSSSSRRTYTSTASSQHPLPARPDWAVGLKPQSGPNQTQGRHNEHSTRGVNGNSSMGPPTQTFVPLQSSAEFPPLSSGLVSPEKRAPVASGAWGKTVPNNLIRTSGSQRTGPNALAQQPNYRSRADQEDSDRGFERPPPKSAELFNPKVLRRPAGAKVHAGQDGGDVAALAVQVGGMTMGGQNADGQSVAASFNDPRPVAVIQ